jgi:hypothetical protein
VIEKSCIFVQETILNNAIMKRIFLVLENGEGTIHRAFLLKETAEQFIESLKEQTDMDCYEIIETILED